MPYAIPASSGWYGATAKATVPQEVKDFLSKAQEFSSLLGQYVTLAQTAAGVIQSAIPLYVDPASAAVEALSSGISTLLEGTSLGSVKMLVLSDVPDISTAIAQQQLPTSAAYAKQAEEAARAQFVAAASTVLSPLAGNLSAPAENLRREALANNLNISIAGGSQPALLSIRERLLASLADVNDLNVPGAAAGSTAIGLSVVAYGDAAAIDAVGALIQLARQLISGFKTEPEAPNGLPGPTNLKVRNLSRARGVNRVQLTWADGLPDSLPLSVEGIRWDPPEVVIERSFDGTSWASLDSRQAAALYDANAGDGTWSKKRLTFKGDLLYIDSALAAAINARIVASLPVGSVRYRIKYVYSAPGQAAAPKTVYGATSYYTPGSRSTAPSVPPDWLGLDYTPDYGVVSEALDQFRAQLDSQAGQTKRALEALVKTARKWIAKIQAVIDKITLTLARINAILGNLTSASVAVRYFDLTGIPYDLNTAEATPQVSVRNLATVSQTPLTARIYQEYSTSMAKLHAAIAPQVSSGAFDCGLGVFFVVESQAAGVIIETLASILGVGAAIQATTQQVSAQLVGLGEQARALWDSTETAVTPLPPVPVPVAAPDPTVQVGESDSPLNINPAPGTYEKPLLGETDYPGADLNCPT